MLLDGSRRLGFDCRLCFVFSEAMTVAFANQKSLEQLLFAEIGR